MGSGRRALGKADSPTAVALASVAKLFQPSAVDWMPVACDAEPNADARTPEATVATWPRFGPAGRLPPTAVLWSPVRSEEHTSELQSLMRISYAVFCLKKKKANTQ